MGYTHYWYLNNKSNQENYEKALDDCRKIVEACTEEYNLCNGMGEEGTKPVLTEGLRFNGCEDESHETFHLPASIQQEHPDYITGDRRDSPFIFDFCKTARKQYDDVVIACLVALKDRLGDDVCVTSDGWSSEERYREYDMMEPGQRLAERILGRKLELPFTEDEE